MDFPNLTFTMTGGGRLPLLIRTMNSFLEHCEDRDLISEWVVMLNNDAAEVEAVRKQFPFLTCLPFVGGGQGAKLNALFAQVKTDFCLHVEDDWQFIRKGHFIREMLSIANSDPRIRNVVLRKWNGVYVKDGAVEFVIHRHRPDLLVESQEIRAKEAARTDALWLGYSLNPGLQHLPTIRMLGPELEDGRMATWRLFDRPFAARYNRFGFLRASTMDSWVEHMGGQKSGYDKHELVYVRDLPDNMVGAKNLEVEFQLFKIERIEV